MQDHNNQDDIYSVPDSLFNTQKNDGSAKVKLFLNALAFRLSGELGWDCSLAADETGKFSPSGVFTGQERVLFLIDAGKEEPDISEFIDFWYDRLKSKELPKTWRHIILLFVFPDGVPEKIRDMVPKAKKLDSFGLAGIYTAYADLQNSNCSFSLEHKMEPFAKCAEAALNDYRKGEAPENLNELQNSLNELYEKTQQFEDRLAKVKPVATYALLAICILIFIWTSISGGSTNIATLLRFGASFKPLFEAGEWWRVVSPIFLHIGFLHLFMNMYILFDIGAKIEQYFGNIKYLVLFFIAGIVGALVSLSFGSSVSAGASGAIFGLCGAAAWIGYRYKDEIPAPSRNRLAGGMMLFIGYNLLFGFSVKGVDNAAHIGGLMAGLIFAILVPPSIYEKKDWTSVFPVRALFVLLAFLPFMAEGYALTKAMAYTGMSSYPLTEYHQADVSFKMPAVFRVQKDNKSTVFVGPGIVVEYVTGSTKGEFDITSWDEEKLKSMKKLDNFAVKNSRFEEFNGRKWVVLDGETEIREGKSQTFLKTRVFITTINGVFYRFTGGCQDIYFSDICDSLQIMVTTLEDNKKK
ncbi:MAG: rhomboid family intramembrane serine protease [Firmicutes bacterium]|nr:rhomboid family intramembrane serine protease [Bacillota bacterium]